MSDPHEYRNESGNLVLSIAETIRLMAMRPGTIEPGARPPEDKSVKYDAVKSAIATTSRTNEKCHLDTAGCIKAAKEKEPVFVTLETFTLLMNSQEVTSLCWRCKHHFENLE
jgi:hypothetical protein